MRAEGTMPTIIDVAHSGCNVSALSVVPQTCHRRQFGQGCWRERRTHRAIARRGMRPEASYSEKSDGSGVAFAHSYNRSNSAIAAMRLALSKTGISTWRGIPSYVLPSTSRPALLF
jgi:hypothetical protein